MRKKFLLSVLLASVASPALANETIDDALTQVSLEYTKMHSNYREYNAGNAFNPNAGGYLDTENGNVNQYGLLSSNFIGPMVLGTAIRYAKGDTRYDGYLQDGTGALEPHQGVTSNTFIDLDANLGLRLNVTDQVAVVPYGALGMRIWERTLGKGEEGSFIETYAHAMVGAGVKTLWSPMPKLTIEAQGLIGKTLAPQMQMEDVTFDLGSKPVYQAGLRADYAILDSVHVNVGYQYERFAYGESDWVDLGNGQGIEPSSKTERNRFTVGIGMGF